MILISHRGNLNGPEPNLENNPKYIELALNFGYDVEIDIRYVDGEYFLGHDFPQYKVTKKFVENQNFWVHCKDYTTLLHFTLNHRNLNFFYHTDEDYVLTSKQYIWAYPGKYGLNNTIAVLPELTNQSINGFAGVCSDYIENYSV